MSDLATVDFGAFVGKKKENPKQQKVNDYFKRFIYGFKAAQPDKPLAVSSLWEDYTDEADETQRVKLNSNNVAAAVKWFNDNDDKYQLEQGNGGYYIKDKPKDNKQEETKEQATPPKTDTKKKATKSKKK